MKINDLATTLYPGELRQSRSLLENSAFSLLAVFALFLPLSINVAQTAAGLAIVLWIIDIVRTKQLANPAGWSVLLPIGVFIVLSLLSVVVSADQMRSLWNARNLLMFLIIPTVAHFVRTKYDLHSLFLALAVGGTVTAVWGIVEVFMGKAGGDNGTRLNGTLGHYMTAGGELMILSICMLGLALFMMSRKSLIYGLAAALLFASALGLTQTRNTYIGLAFGLVGLFYFWKRGLVFLLPFVISLAVLLSPPIVRERIYQTADMADASIISRFNMVQTGYRMTADYPVFGVGLNQVSVYYNRYKPDGDEFDSQPHLHNNVVQIAAERGIPAMLVWIWFILALAIGHVRIIRKPGAPRWLKMSAAVAVATVIALLSAGLFEYNFGDSEVLMLFLLVVTLPFGLAAGLREETSA